VNSATPEPARLYDETRKLIIETARDQLRRFGQDKLTVVDIARSLGMSHANIYRFFNSKAEILDAIIDDWLARVESFVESVASRPGSAAERLEAVVMEIHRKRRAKYREDAQVYGSFRRLIESRPDAVAKREEKLFNVFKKIIAMGVETGELAGVNPEAAAMVLEDATAIFLHPMIMPATLNERTEERARNVVRTIVNGLASKNALQGDDFQFSNNPVAPSKGSSGPESGTTGD